MGIYDEALINWDYLKEIKSNIKKNKNGCITGLSDAAKPHLSYVLSEESKCVLFVTYSEKRVRQFENDCKLFFGDCSYFPERDILFYKADIGAGLINTDRMSVFKSLLCGEGRCFITTFSALMNSTVSPVEMKRRMISIAKRDTIDMEMISKKLVEIGYERAYRAEMPGQFAVRGDIIDVYSVVEETPYRIELWGDDVEEIKSFDAESQRSLETFEKIVIFPATEDFDGLKKDSTILDYIEWDSVRCFLDEPARLDESAKTVLMEINEAYEGRVKAGVDVSDLDGILDPAQIFAKLSMHGSIALSTIGMNIKEFEPDYEAHIGARSVSGYQNSFELLLKDLSRYKKNKYRMLILSASRTRAARLAKDIEEAGFSAFYTTDRKKSIEPGEVVVFAGRLSQGFEYPEAHYVVISEGDIFPAERERKKKEKKKERRANAIKSFNELHIGDYVVHENHGIGIYRGIEKVERDHIIKDYMKIEYAKGSNLYILATQLDMIQKYASGEGKALPKLSNLGTMEWGKTRSKVKKAVEEIAQDLVELYAKRLDAKGFVYEPDTVWQKEFEEMFPYEETSDQLKAISDVKEDMESGRVMDRLICGDVGFGKTEVAIRAAFKAVQNGKQVAYLVPTTILAKQHYDTFMQRFSSYPVKVELMCRFRTQTEQKHTAKHLADGSCDIVIGTHRILGKDVSFKDLGLLIVDEEQRFGVGHKEKIKKLKNNVNVMSLTATPIPRTLHMSLSGIRDMSLLEEPPIDRMPIQTYVMEYHDEMVREAIERELAREGQVYFIYNRVDSIADMAARVESLVPDAVVAYAHGRMEERELENIMFRFVNGEIDVLISTTIVETGLDIPNVNTIIISGAERFGLSQLYQLRGRVGRSGRTAYAFLMYRRDRMISEIAEKRLDAIREFTELGSGIRIAMRDLEIRGAGNILGESQSGHMAAVGYDLYCKLLSEAVKKAKGEQEEEQYDTAMELMLDAYIPDEYIPSEMEKLDMYRRIAALSDEGEYEDLSDELIDRFGPIPEEVRLLMWIGMTKVRAHGMYITGIKENKNTLTVTIYPKAKLDPLKLTSMVRDYKGLIRLLPEPENPRFICEEKAIAQAGGVEKFLTGFLEAFSKSVERN